MITLATLSEATEQEVFDQVATHLLRQNEKCAVGDTCLYRAGKLACAAGCLISEDEYSDEMEVGSWVTLVSKGYAPGTHKKLICRLQGIHDTGSVFTWAIRLTELANEWGLSAAVVCRGGAE
jgi:hypothetical protein